MATTPEEAEAVRAFAICDTNGDQKIDRAQLAFFLRALGQNPTQNEVNELPAEVDFAAAWKYYQEHKKEPLDVSVLEDLFSVWDKDRTGEIKFDDLAQCLKIFGRLSNDAFTQEEIDHLKTEAQIDDNAGGMFNYQEFLNLMVQTQKPHETGAVDGAWPKAAGSSGY
eukprot:TRINITY_DN11905_c0_g1_i12.p2 TRINITY_DN11905_c0_g1~~TRINITY_DN11905_c0_g1_i12.p2  ORF type:complete len:167 (+),score=47.23 TRINITY_DN11905_c0_g1_i12:219-719(+)